MPEGIERRREQWAREESVLHVRLALANVSRRVPKAKPKPPRSPDFTMPRRLFVSSLSSRPLVSRVSSLARALAPLCSRRLAWLCSSPVSDVTSNYTYSCTLTLSLSAHAYSQESRNLFRSRACELCARSCHAHANRPLHSIDAPAHGATPRSSVLRARTRSPTGALW